MSTQTQTKEVEAVEIINYGFNVKNPDAKRMFPVLNEESTSVIVIGRGEDSIDKKGNTVVPLVLMQNSPIGSNGDSNSSAMQILLGWNKYKTLRTIQNVSPEIANSLELGDSLPEELNLELRRQVVPFWEDQQAVMIDGVEQHYYNNTVVVEGPASHHGIPETPEDL